MPNISSSWCEVCHLLENVHYSNISKHTNYMGNNQPETVFRLNMSES